MRAPLCLPLVLALPLVAQVPIYEVGPGHADLNGGMEVANLGDVDADGVPDFAIGLPLSSRPGSSERHGSVAVHSGASGALLYRLFGPPRAQMGSAVAGVGDLDGDGAGDFVVGMMSLFFGAELRPGGAELRSGRDGRLLATFIGDGEGDLFGYYAAGVGDVDADGVPDFAVGAPENGNPVGNYGPGYVKVFSGATRALLHRFVGAVSADEFGSAITGAGDVDGDGHDDVAVCAYLEASGVSAGSVTVFSGRTGQVMRKIFGPAGEDHFGISVVNVGDVDRDGIDDLAMGSANIWTNRNNGQVYLHSGRDGRRLWVVAAAATGGMFGACVAPAGDVDGDGIPDVLAGDPMHRDPVTGNSGIVRLLSGATARELWSRVGPNAMSGFGLSIAPLGDLDGDRRSEFVVTSPGAQRPVPGAAMLFTHADRVSPFGRGCGALRTPRLDGTAPTPGRTFSMLLSDHLSGSPAVLLASAPPPVPTPRAGCVLYVDPLSAATLQFATPDAAGRALAAFPLANDSRLVGLRLVLQTAQVQAGALAFSQGLFVTVR